MLEDGIHKLGKDAVHVAPVTGKEAFQEANVTPSGCYQEGQSRHGAGRLYRESCKKTT